MTYKKSKYRHVVINKKRYYFYKITWLDILGDSGHADNNEFMDMKPAVMITVHMYFIMILKYLEPLLAMMLTLNALAIVMYFQKVC